MSPPIRDGSGSSIGSIRLGDGSEISEVRTGAGDVLFSAIPDSVVDHFEQPLYEDQGKTLSDYYGGEISNYQRQQSTVFEGNHALEPTADQTAIQDDGGDFSLSTNTTWEFYQRHTSSGSDGGWLWMCQNESGRSSRSCYLANIRSNSGDIRIRLVENGNTSGISTASASIPQNEWMRGVVEHLDNGSITFTVFDSSGNQIAQTSGTDTTFTSGGHGFSNFNSDLIFDNVREV